MDKVSKYINIAALDGTLERFDKLKFDFGETFISDYMRDPEPNLASLPESVSSGLSLSVLGVNAFTLTCKGRKGDVVVSLPSYPGWVAKYPDGSTRPMQPVNAIMQKVGDVPADSAVRLVYEPFSFRLGLYVSLLGLVIVVVLYLVTRNRRINQ